MIEAENGGEAQRAADLRQGFVSSNDYDWP